MRRSSHSFILFILCVFPLYAYNPIDENLSYSASSIRELKVIRNIPGSCNNPGSIIFDLKIADLNGTPLTFLSNGNFYLNVGGKRVRNYLVQSEGDSYKIVIPRLPYQSHDGIYSLGISVGSLEGGTTPVCKTPVVYRSPMINLILVVDTSTSMKLNDPGNYRQKAIRNILSYARVNNVISRIAIVKFSTVASLICPFTSVADSESLEKAIGLIDADGETAVGDGLDKAYDEFLKAGAGEKTIVILLTDGENNGPWNGNYKKFAEKNTPVYTVGLTGSVNAKFLSEIAESTGGEFFQIPDSFKIQSIYGRIINTEINRKTFFSSEVVLQPGQETNIAFKPERTMTKVNIFSYSSAGGAKIMIRPESTKFAASSQSNFEAFELRDLQSRPYHFNMKNRSGKTNTCFLEAFIADKIMADIPSGRRSFSQGEPVPLTVLVYQDDTPLAVNVHAVIRSARVYSTMRLFDDGRHGDDLKNDGTYRNFFIPDGAGLFEVVIDVTGKNLYSEPFRRTLKMSFSVSDKEEAHWIVTPLNVDFQKTGSEVEYFKSFELSPSGSAPQSSAAIKIISMPVTCEGEETLARPVIKPVRFVAEAGRKKLFNISVKMPSNLENGRYDGRLILEAGGRYLDVPYVIDFNKYLIPTDGEMIRRTEPGK